MNSLKLLIVTGIFPPDHGGPASYVPAIATALSQKHTIIAVITLTEDQTYDDAIYPFPVKRIRRQQNRLIRRIQTIATIYQLAKTADVVYLNGLVLEGVIASKILRRKPTVIKVVGDMIWERARVNGVTQDTIDDFQHKSYNLKWNFLKKLQGWYTNLADKIITPSQYLAEIVAQWGISKNKINVIYNSVHTLPSDDKINQDKQIDCITVARLVPWKGISELINVVIPNNWTLNIIGDGILKTTLEKQVNPSQTHLVKFLGYIPKEQVIEEIAKAKIFILNSTYEGLPHIVLEAKAAGVPVIATAVGGTPETITDGVNGYLIQAGDNQALTEKIRYLLDNPGERQRIGQAGQKQVKEFFSFDKMVLQTEQVLICN